MKSPFKRCLLLLLILAPAPGAMSAPASDDPRPLSPAQIALFMTPQLQNIDHPETLSYHYTRTGRDAFDDTVSERVQTIHPDGTKSVAFTYLTGEHHKLFPPVDNFSGNPLLMLFLESDVQTMKETIGVSANYFRDQVREAMVDRATVVDTSVQLDGRTVPAREVIVRPFTTTERLARLPSVQAKTYRFVLSDAVPGGIAVMQTTMPADGSGGIVASGEAIVFQGVTP